jgi:hypothetical protein
MPEIPTDAVQKLIADAIGRAAADQRVAASNATTDMLEATTRAGSSGNRIVLGGGASLLGLISVFSGWYMDRVERDEEQADTIVQMEASHRTLVDQNQLLQRKVQQMGLRLVSMEVQTSEGFGWLAKKIDAAHPRSRKYKAPPAIREAANRAGRAQNDRRLSELFGADSIAVE